MDITKIETMIAETKLLLIQAADKTLKLPEPEETFKLRIEECEKAGLGKQKETAIYEMRKNQFKALGFYPFSQSEAVEWLMGAPHTDTEEGDKHTPYDYHYRHNEHTVDAVKDGKVPWGVPNITIYIRKKYRNSWFIPPFIKKEVWRIKAITTLNAFESAIPGNMLAGLNVMRTKGFFNTYRGYEHENKAILLGGIECLEEKSDKASTSMTFFLGVFGDGC